MPIPHKNEAITRERGRNKRNWPTGMCGRRAPVIIKQLYPTAEDFREAVALAEKKEAYGDKAG